MLLPYIKNNFSKIDLERKYKIRKESITISRNYEVKLIFVAVINHDNHKLFMGGRIYFAYSFIL